MSFLIGITLIVCVLATRNSTDCSFSHSKSEKRLALLEPFERVIALKIVTKLFLEMN